MKKLNIYGIYAALFPIVIILCAIGLPALLTTILWLGGGGLLYLFISLKIETKTKLYAEYTSNDKTLHLHKRGGFLKNSITMKRYMSTTAVYKPAEIVYTGATVGGITTGGVHVNEAHYDAYSSKTDKFGLYYNDSLIEKIVCDFEIEDHPAINEFKTDKNTLVTTYRKAKKGMDKFDKMMYKNAVNAGDQGMQCHLLNKEIMSDMISRDDCNKLLKWILGKI